MTQNQVAWFRALNEKEHNERYDAEYYRHNTATERAAIYSANLSAVMDKYKADRAAEASIYSANQHYAGTVYSADKAYQGSVYSADRHYAGQVYSADRNAEAHMYSADRNAEASKYSANMHYLSSIYGADRSYDAATYTANVNLLGTKYNADAHRAATEYSANKSYAASRLASQDETARQADRNLNSYNIATLNADKDMEIAKLKDQTQKKFKQIDVNLKAADLEHDTWKFKVGTAMNFATTGINAGTDITRSIIGGVSNILSRGLGIAVGSKMNAAV